MRISDTRLFLIAIILLSALPTFAEDALDRWYFRDARVVNKIRFVENFFIGVGNNGLILTSPDGQTWTARNSGTTANLYGVTIGTFLFPTPSRFVAVGAGGTILLSSNAVDWVPVNSGYTCDLNDVAAGSLLVVASTTKNNSNEPNLLTSSSGTIWSPKFLTNGIIVGHWTHNIAVAGNTFIVASGGGLGDEIWTSTGGSSWQSRGLVSLAVRGVAYGNNRLVGIGFENSPIVSTNTGATWFRAPDTIGCPSNGSCLQGYDIAFGNSTFAAPYSTFGTSGLATTTNGVTWAKRSALSGKSIVSITFGNGTFVATGTQGIFQSEPVSTPGLSVAKNVSSNALNLTITGEVGRGYRLQTSINVSNWFDRLSFTNTSPSIDFVEAITNASHLLYRVVTP